MDKHIVENNKLKLLLTPFILLGIILTSMTLTVVFQYKTIDELQNTPYERLIIGFIESLVIAFTYNFVVRKLNKVYPWKRNWFVRTLIDSGLALIFPIIIVSFIDYALKVGWIPPHNHDAHFKIMIFIMPVMVSTLILVIVEMIVATEERRILEVQLANIEKEQIKTKYTALKGQLDHHFLFNNLSVLSSIIYESPEKADGFIQDFASIYRYVLSINEQDIVSLNKELDFINKYLNLYKFRFEQGFNYKLTVDDKYNKWLIPPLTLQVLVENVIKHNVVSRQKPLNLSISNNGSNLIVKNNLQTKESKKDSTNTGQQNLIGKFELLNCSSPEFKIENNHYISVIPLIEPTDD